MTKTVLLVCGAGASSGFMAGAARKAAKKLDVDIQFKAKSESEISENLNDIDLLLVAPHLKYMIDDVKEECDKAGVKYAIIPQKIYGVLDGKGLVKIAEEQLQGGEQ
ncbi:PTS lactose transporter subunit IIB [Pullulanibacillus camelliae]|uniref:PTS lactose transporter subunit IIB n=1 Tax=Pullulanibacillus camelliae TaxID=1707096 RepID=A0A8J2YE60_9BACL|nr:PTS sugar transporter subunit IIB [Pullulanibacillus camelliae]GGE27653.1 PTS lactose transporter subunit IIB [Pullulanibacillus camelliae]